jgi:drug/metabolite transporter (DMT)-like permease
VLHERVGPREIASVVAICVGLAVLAIAGPSHTVTQGSSLEIALALGAIGAAALFPYLMSALSRRPGITVVLSSGLAYAWCGITTKLVSDAVGAGEWGAVVVWVAATAAGAGVGLLSEMTALQTRPATRVAPVVLVVDIVVAVAFAAVVVGERWDVTPSGGALVAGALVLVTAGAAVLASSPAVAAATHPEARGQRAT